MGAFLRKRKNGRYYAIFYDEETKKRKEKATGTSNKKAAEAFLKELELKWYRGQYDPFSKKSSKGISKLVKEFLATKEKEGKASETIITYENVLTRFSEAIGSTRYLTSITTEEVLEWVTSGDVKDSTIKHRIRHIKAFFNFYKRKKFIKMNPVDDISFSGKKCKLPVAIEECQLDSITNAVVSDYIDKMTEGSIAKGEIIWYVFAFWLCFLAGLRIREVARLRWKHVRLTERYLELPTQKNRKEDRVKLSKRATELLSTLEEGEPNEFVIRGPRTTTERNYRSFCNNVGRKFREYRDKAKVDSEITLHSTRHGFCTRLAKNGAPAYLIQSAARHSNVQTSMIYVHLADQDVRNEIDDAFGD